MDKSHPLAPPSGRLCRPPVSNGVARQMGWQSASLHTAPFANPPPPYPFFLGGGWRPTFRPLFSIDHPFPTALVGLAQHRPVRPEIENSFSDSFSACAASVPIFRVSRVCVCVTECVPRECVGNERNLSNEWLFLGEKLFQKRKNH